MACDVLFEMETRVCILGFGLGLAFTVREQGYKKIIAT